MFIRHGGRNLENGVFRKSITLQISFVGDNISFFNYQLVLRRQTNQVKAEITFFGFFVHFQDVLAPLFYLSLTKCVQSQRWFVVTSAKRRKWCAVPISDKFAQMRACETIRTVTHFSWMTRVLKWIKKSSICLSLRN